jgi:TRAP-type C4-dicarboxylate transport system substrate-binding protein
VPSSRHSAAVINEKFWQRLSAAHRKTIVSAAQAADKEAAALLANVEATAYKLLADKGVRIIDLPEDELVRWRICSSNVLTNFVEKSGDFEQRLLSAYGRLRQQPCCNQPMSAEKTQ